MTVSISVLKILRYAQDDKWDISVLKILRCAQDDREALRMTTYCHVERSETSVTCLYSGGAAGGQRWFRRGDAPEWCAEPSSGSQGPTEPRQRYAS